MPNPLTPTTERRGGAVRPLRESGVPLEFLSPAMTNLLLALSAYSLEYQLTKSVGDRE